MRLCTALLLTDRLPTRDRECRRCRRRSRQSTHSSPSALSLAHLRPVRPYQPNAMMMQPTLSHSHLLPALCPPFPGFCICPTSLPDTPGTAPSTWICASSKHNPLVAGHPKQAFRSPVVISVRAGTTNPSGSRGKGGRRTANNPALRRCTQGFLERILRIAPGGGVCVCKMIKCSAK